MNRYAICTLVTDFEQYNQMKETFLSAGFDDDCEYLLIVNSAQNNYDGYKVLNLDENFLLINNKFQISCSINLFGFHFYGTDLCLQALAKGCSSYVIDFYLTHLVRGKVDESFFDCRKNLIEKYSIFMKDQYIRTTCSKIFISNNSLKQNLFNNKYAIQIKTLVDRFRD